MKAFIRTLAVALAAVLAIGAPIPANAALDDFLGGTSLAKDDWLILTSEYGRDGHHSQLSVQPGGVEEGGTRGEWIQCKTINDEGCNTSAARKNLLAWSMLPDCSTADSKVCIESIKIGKNTGELLPAKYQSELISMNDFPGDSKLNLLPGRGLPLYEIDPASEASNTTKLAVMVRSESFWKTDSKTFSAERLEVEVIPYMLIPRGSKTLGCGFVIENQCAVIQDFNVDTRVELTFNVPNDIGGWFSGRMKAPNISDLNTIVVSAEPVEVAALGVVKNFKNFSAKEKMWQQNHGKWSVGDGQWATGANTWQEDVFPFIEYYRKEVKDTAIGTNRVWKFMSIGGGSGSRCLADKSKVLGMVTTNALGYAGESPQFKNGFLDYKVAGLHYARGGEELNLGVYDFVMRSDTARCLYGFSKAPLSATVSVTNDKGNKTMATTVVSEKNGWLKMAAYGFTFSKKTIKVKITKKKK
jgi:hypothetical protein